MRNPNGSIRFENLTVDPGETRGLFGGYKETLGCTLNQLRLESLIKVAHLRQLIDGETQMVMLNPSLVEVCRFEIWKLVLH